MEDEGIVKHAARLGDDVIGPGLRALGDQHRWVGEVRGTGAFWALDLVRDRESREPMAPDGGSSPEMAAIATACYRRGLLPLVIDNRVHVAPPLTTSVEEARAGLDILSRAFSDASASLGS